MTRLLTTSEYLLYVTLTNYIAVLAGVTLWSALFLLGLVARRLEQAFAVATGWRLLLTAPSGILMYTVYTLVSASGGPGTQAGSELERRIAYGALLASALLSLWGCGATWALLLRLAMRQRKTESPA